MSLEDRDMLLMITVTGRVKARTAQRMVGAGVLLGLMSPAVPAHDFWIEPSLFQPPSGSRVTLRLRVGEHFLHDLLDRAGVVAVHVLQRLAHQRGGGDLGARLADRTRGRSGRRSRVARLELREKVAHRWSHPGRVFRAEAAGRARPGVPGPAAGALAAAAGPAGAWL